MKSRNDVNKWTCAELTSFGIAWNHCNNEKTSYEVPRWASNTLSLVVYVREKVRQNPSWLEWHPFPRRGGKNPMEPQRQNIWPIREVTTRWGEREDRELRRVTEKTRRVEIVPGEEWKVGTNVGMGESGNKEPGVSKVEVPEREAEGPSEERKDPPRKWILGAAEMQEKKEGIRQEEGKEIYLGEPSRRETAEAGEVEGQKKERILSQGWAWIWMEKPWTNQWDYTSWVAERSRREVRSEKPSYWGEIVEEKDQVEKRQASWREKGRNGEAPQRRLLAWPQWVSCVYWNPQEKQHISRCLRIPNPHRFSFWDSPFPCNHISIDEL